jgi:flagellar protein FliS
MRFLRDRVMTATPAQRVVMLYDRLGLDLTLAIGAEDATGCAPHLDHATQVVAELLASLNPAAGGPAENLADLYGYLLRELIAARTSAGSEGLPALADIVTRLREAWAQVAEQTTIAATTPPTTTATAWVG